MRQTKQGMIRAMPTESALKGSVKKSAVVQTTKRGNRTYDYRERPKGYCESIKSSSLAGKS